MAKYLAGRSAEALRLPSIIIKVAARCNLNCSYCYVYNKKDASWAGRPPLMSASIFDAAVSRIREHCLLTDQKHVRIHFHGGEPCLLGPERLGHWCDKAAEALASVAQVEFGIQTNGTLLDDRWAETFKRHRMRVGISIDGPAVLHDRSRYDHRNRGSHGRIVAALHALRAAGIPFHILTVIPLGAPPLEIHEHLLSLGPTEITYIMPDFTHEEIADVRRRHGGTPCADFLVPIFDEWWFNGTLDVVVKDLWNVARLMMGGTSEIETFGNRPPRYAFIETDGAIEGLDCLRSCAAGLSSTGLNVRTSALSDIADAPGLHSRAIFEGMPLPSACRGCQEEATCAGGYLAHRYSNTAQFDNKSVWCADILRLFGHIRERMDVSVQETAALRAELSTAPYEAEAVCR